jgi:hypothetical protein
VDGEGTGGGVTVVAAFRHIVPRPGMEKVRAALAKELLAERQTLNRCLRKVRAGEDQYEVYQRAADASRNVVHRLRMVAIATTEYRYSEPVEDPLSETDALREFADRHGIPLPAGLHIDSNLYGPKSRDNRPPKPPPPPKDREMA